MAQLVELLDPIEQPVEQGGLAQQLRAVRWRQHRREARHPPQRAQ
jgi:hypothetical protein